MTRVLDRALDILEALASAEDAISLAEVREGLEISPATAHRLLRTMVRRGYVDQDQKSRRYGPGPKLLEVAARSTMNRHLDLRRMALPCLRKLTVETEETSNLVLPYGTDEVVYIEQSKSPRTVSIFTQVGYRAPLYCTAAVLNHVGACVGAVSVSGPSSRIDRERIFREVGPLVRRQAAECSLRLGYDESTDGTRDRGIWVGI